MKRLSVIVPGFDTREAWWHRCVTSILDALGADDEVLCIDDGSPVPPKCLGELAAKDGRVRVLRHEKNLGLPSARNTGLDAAEGRFVAFVDSDDEVRPDAFERSIEALERHAADVAVYGIRSMYVDDGFEVHDVPEAKFYGELSPADVGYLVKKRLFYYSCNKVFRKGFLDERNMRFRPEGVPCEDAIFNVALVVNKAKWVTVPCEGYIYYRYDGSLLSTYKPTYVEGTRACTKAWRDYKDSTPGAYEALAKYGLEKYDETSDEGIVRGQWTNIWRRKSPYGLGARWRYAKEHADVLGRATLLVFLKKAAVMFLRAHCYFRPLRILHEKRFLSRIGAKVEKIKERRFVSVMNIPSPYRLPLFEEVDRQLWKRGISYHVDFMARGHKERPKSWRNPPLNVSHRYWLDIGFGQHHFNPGLVLKLVFKPPHYLDLGSPYDTFTCILLALFCRAKVKIMTLEGNTKTPGRLDGFIGAFKRFIMKRATYLPVPGSDARRFIDLHRERTAGRLGESPYLPNIIDESKFKPRECWPKEAIAAARRDMGAGEGDRLCIIPARLVEVKGLVPFLKAVDSKCLAGWKVVIVGQGPLRSEIEKLAFERGLSGTVSIMDYIDYEKMPEHYAASDLMLLPSVQDMNPLSVVEAVFSGLPIALSDQVGNVEEGVSEGRNGWILPVKDESAYAAKLSEVFSMQVDRLREMGRVSLEENSRFWRAGEAISKYLDVVVGAGDG